MIHTDEPTDRGGLPVITLWQPWATWIMLGWKKIETRTHSKFGCLLYKRIGIHAGLQFDVGSLVDNNPYLAPAQIRDTMPIKVPRGALLGTAYVWQFRQLGRDDSNDALIECETTVRYGLFLRDIEVFAKPIPMRGAQGIWMAPQSFCEYRANDMQGAMAPLTREPELEFARPKGK